MRQERDDARQQRTNRGRTQRDDHAPAGRRLPCGVAARQPPAAEQRADDDREAEVLDRHRREAQDAEESFVHHFTVNV